MLEARDRLGGRIESISFSDLETIEGSEIAEPSDNCFDLGPSWYWPEFQTQLGRLVQSLGLTSYQQYEEGDMKVEGSDNEPPMRMRGYTNSPSSIRLSGGMKALTEALASSLPSNKIKINHKVNQITKSEKGIQLTFNEKGGKENKYLVSHVFLALPPRIVSKSLLFTPTLPSDLKQQWQQTPTWMAPHAKYFAVYDKPFWREQGLSGSARSMLGPLNEIYNASIPNGPGALFGFLGVPASSRQSLSDDDLKHYCRMQLVRIYGEQAKTPIVEFYKDWSADPFTATLEDQNSNGQHVKVPPAIINSGEWKGVLYGIGSEWSEQFPGYTAGAIDAADTAVNYFIRQR